MILKPIEISRHPGESLCNFRRIVHYSTPVDEDTRIIIQYRVQFLEVSGTTNDVKFINLSGQTETGTSVARRWMVPAYTVTRTADDTTKVNTYGQIVPADTPGAMGQYSWFSYVLDNNLAYYKDLWYGNIQQLDALGAFDVYQGEG